MKSHEFIKGVEKLINPIDVGTLHYMQSFNEYIPKKVQHKMVAASGKKTPYMGFVVEPYSYFLFYPLQDLDRAKSLLPPGYDLMKTKVFEEDEENYYGVFGCFTAHTSGFWGSRIEFYLIAKDLETDMLSWIIVDYDTNTITYDPRDGLSKPNVENGVLTVDYTGSLLLEMKSSRGRRLQLVSDLTKGQKRSLDQRLWVEGNLSIAYGGEKADQNPGKFSLLFQKDEFSWALDLPKEATIISDNNWYPGLLGKEPAISLCFPYAQHFLSDSPGHRTPIANEGELGEALQGVKVDQLKVFSAEGFKKFFFLGGLISFGIHVTLITLLFL